jgi:hypothetical protein
MIKYSTFEMRCTTLKRICQNLKFPSFFAFIMLTSLNYAQHTDKSIQ